MSKAKERHQVVPYLQVQPDWNVITDTVRLFGMMKKIPTSNIPKEFVSRGLGGDEIVIKLPDEPLNVFWMSLYRYNEEEECSNGAHVTVTVEYDPAAAAKSFLRLRCSHQSLRVECAADGKSLQVFLLGDNQQPDISLGNFIIRCPIFSLPTFGKNVASNGTKSSSKSSQKQMSIGVFNSSLSSTDEDETTVEEQSPPSSSPNSKVKVGEKPYSLMNQVQSLTENLLSSKMAASEDQYRQLHTLFSKSNATMQNVPTTDIGSGSILALDVNSEGEVLAVGEYSPPILTSTLGFSSTSPNMGSSNTNTDEARISILSTKTTDSANINDGRSEAQKSAFPHVIPQHALDPTTFSRNFILEDERSLQSAIQSAGLDMDADAEIPMDSIDGNHMIDAEEEEITRSKMAEERKADESRRKAQLARDAHISADLVGHWGGVTSAKWLSLSASSTSLYITGGQDCSVRLWARDFARPIRTFRGHQRPVTAVDTMDRTFENEKPSSSKTLLSTSKDGTLRMWDISTASCVSVFSHHAEKQREDSIFLAQNTDTFDDDNEYLAMCTFQDRSVNSTILSDVIAVGTSRCGVALFDTRTRPEESNGGVFSFAPSLFCPIPTSYEAEEVYYTGFDLVDTALHLENYKALGKYFSARTPKSLVPNLTAVEKSRSGADNASLPLRSISAHQTYDLLHSGTNAVTSIVPSQSNPFGLFCATEKGLLCEIDIRTSATTLQSMALRRTYRASSAAITTMKSVDLRRFNPTNIEKKNQGDKIVLGTDEGDVLLWERKKAVAGAINENDFRTSTVFSGQVSRINSISLDYSQVKRTSENENMYQSMFWLATGKGAGNYDFTISLD